MIAKEHSIRFTASRYSNVLRNIRIASQRVSAGASSDTIRAILGDGSRRVSLETVAAAGCYFFATLFRRRTGQTPAVFRETGGTQFLRKIEPDRALPASVHSPGIQRGNSAPIRA